MENIIKFDLNRMLFTLTSSEHDIHTLKNILNLHPEVKFVSLTGVDMGGHHTDEKIPMQVFLEDIETILKDGVQTDGSSVALPTIADLSNARVDILPDLDVNWFVDYNYDHIDYETNLPTGTLRIPSFLRHNGDTMVGSRIYLKKTVEIFKKEIMLELEKNPYVFDYIGKVNSVEEIEELVLTNATELEFWVKTPDDKADRDQLFIAQQLKEQYWKRVTGPVATALEQTLEILDHYGFGVEMGHKEVGGVKAKMGHSGEFNHIMEQLEIDWKYASPMQAADNEAQVKDVVRDIFRLNGLDVTFLAKPMFGVAGSGEHTHFGVAAKLKSGELINLFETENNLTEFMSPIGFGALMGILKNYEMLNPIVSPTHDSFQRLKPGYEAPVCIVTSLGVDHKTPSRNRTVLIGLVRDLKNPMATRFELRSPNPHTNSYLVIGATYLLMIDGIRAVLNAKKTSSELEKSISKQYGESDFYLEMYREYRSEKNIYKDYSEEERVKLFGEPPLNVWTNFKTWNDNGSKLWLITAGDENLARIINSFKAQMMNKWSMEYHDRYLPNTMNMIRGCKKLHGEDASEYDIENWKQVCELKNRIGKDGINKDSMLLQAKLAVEKEDYDKLSELELMISDSIEELRKAYNKYRRNIF